ncbi:MAG: hypothetical protein M3238_03795 [Actinomycetota bacterium]|nr:hypothetical protein [Actinomycetota bacterium]
MKTSFRPPALLFGVLLLLGSCNDVTFVDRVIITNDTDYSATVDVRHDGGGWLGLTTVPARQTRTVEEVIDRGDSWTFRFAYGSRDPLLIEMSRDQLIDAGWRVEVPLEFEENLRDEGVLPPP